MLWLLTLTLAVTPMAWAQSGPRAAWGFQAGSGSVALDSSGNGNDGQLLNGGVWEPGRVGPTGACGGAIGARG